MHLISWLREHQEGRTSWRSGTELSMAARFSQVRCSSTTSFVQSLEERVRLCATASAP